MSLITVNIDTRSITAELKALNISQRSIAESLGFIVEALKAPSNGGDDEQQNEIDTIASRLGDANDKLEAAVELYGNNQ